MGRNGFGIGERQSPITTLDANLDIRKVTSRIGVWQRPARCTEASCLSVKSVRNAGSGVLSSRVKQPVVMRLLRLRPSVVLRECQADQAFATFQQRTSVTAFSGSRSNHVSTAVGTLGRRYFAMAISSCSG